ncbi:preprotein translocase subunit SecE [Candidatus Tenderia electrophaga]|jgi:preprotein translocase subunit SecE|uniref:Protein translocase subunit SecE n=1 Tax=Candidatus Tenderia electrophaga TaxID=1748243 RepID=A0A0S2TB42_9GAMM|nr:preprotein translocase subunit SecE [Candidatus Tenderia electrophaga]
MDKLKLTIALALVAAGVVGFYYFPDQSLLMRVLGLLAAAGIALAVAYQTAVGQRTWGFVTGAQTEIKKVVWPTRKEALQTTGIVVVMVLIVALFLWGLDSILLWLVRLLTGQGE